MWQRRYEKSRICCDEVMTGKSNKRRKSSAKESVKMSDKDDAIAASNDASAALDEVRTGIKAMESAKDRAALDAAFNTVKAKVELVKAKAVVAFTKSLSANSAEADDAADRAREFALQAERAKVHAQVFHDRKLASLP